MIAKLLSRHRAATQRAGAKVPAGQRFYAIGDIHGRLDLLNDLLTQIDRDDAQRATANTTLVFLGDLVDRGPHSAGVLERLLRLARARPVGATRFLMGNHEEVFLRAVAGELPALRLFSRMGGRETIISYGISDAQYRTCDFDDLLALFQARVPPDHIAFVSSFESLIVAGDYAFVHAGVKPTLALPEQKPEDLRWIRDEFLNFTGVWDKVVVHGHSVTREIEFRAHRIGIDTGAFATGRLSAIGLEGCERWILQT